MLDECIDCGSSNIIRLRDAIKMHNMACDGVFYCNECNTEFAVYKRVKP
jgi:hypothetical protein